MLCKNCGNEIPNDSTFCVKCGNKIDVSEKQAQNDKQVTENAPDSKQHSEPIKSQKKKKTALIISIVAVAVLCIGIAIMLPIFLPKNVTINDYTFSNGYYKGTYYGSVNKDNLPDGKGTYKGEAIMGYGEIEYEGEFSNGEINGFGILKSVSSSGVTVEEGYWKDGRLNGQGTRKWTCSSDKINEENIDEIKEEIYEGNWVDGSRAYGKWTETIVYMDDYKVVKSVEYKNGKLNGEFTENGEMEDGSYKESRSGEYVDGVLNGKYTETIENKGCVTKILCEYKDGQKNGQYTKTIEDNGDISIELIEYMNEKIIASSSSYTYKNGDTRYTTYDLETEHHSRVYTYASGELIKYADEWDDINGKYDNLVATYTYANGDVEIWETSYDNIMKTSEDTIIPHGYGVLTTKYASNGKIEIKEGTWDCGEFVG